MKNKEIYIKIKLEMCPYMDDPPIFTVTFMSCWSLCMGMNKIYQGV